MHADRIRLRGSNGPANRAGRVACALTLLALLAVGLFGCGGTSPSAPARELDATFEPAITEATAAPGSVYLRPAGVRMIDGVPHILIDIMVKDVPPPGISDLGVKIQYDDPSLDERMLRVARSGGEGEFFESVGLVRGGLGPGCDSRVPRGEPFGLYNCASYVTFAVGMSGEPVYAQGSGRAGRAKFTILAPGSSNVFVRYQGTHVVRTASGSIVIEADSVLAGHLTVF